MNTDESPDLSLYKDAPYGHRTMDALWAALAPFSILLGVAAFYLFNDWWMSRWPYLFWLPLVSLVEYLCFRIQYRTRWSLPRRRFAILGLCAAGTIASLIGLPYFFADETATTLPWQRTALAIDGHLHIEVPGTIKENGTVNFNSTLGKVRRTRVAGDRWELTVHEFLDQPPPNVDAIINWYKEGQPVPRPDPWNPRRIETYARILPHRTKASSIGSMKFLEIDDEVRGWRFKSYNKFRYYAANGKGYVLFLQVVEPHVAFNERIFFDSLEFDQP